MARLGIGQAKAFVAARIPWWTSNNDPEQMGIHCCATSTNRALLQRWLPLSNALWAAVNLHLGGWGRHPTRPSYLRPPAPNRCNWISTERLTQQQRLNHARGATTFYICMGASSTAYTCWLFGAVRPAGFCVGAPPCCENSTALPRARTSGNGKSLKRSVTRPPTLAPYPYARRAARPPRRPEPVQQAAGQERARAATNSPSEAELLP